MKKFLRAGVFIVAVSMIIYGITIGEYIDVIEKGARICLECIGIE